MTKESSQFTLFFFKFKKKLRKRMLNIKQHSNYSMLSHVAIQAAENRKISMHLATSYRRKTKVTFIWH